MDGTIVMKYNRLKRELKELELYLPYADGLAYTQDKARIAELERQISLTWPKVVEELSDGE